MGGFLSSPGACDATGSCECGRVKLKVTEQPLIAFKCHCSICRSHLRSMKGGVSCSSDELESQLDSTHHHPTVVGIFRRGAVVIVEGRDHIGHVNTRGSFPFVMGTSRGYCKECKTTGVRTTIRTTIYWVLFGGAEFVTLGNTCGPALLQDFAFHICFDTATERAKQLTANDGKRKYGLIAGVFAIMACVYFPVTKRLFSNNPQKSD